MTSTTTLPSHKQESALRYLASRMMGDTWNACQLAIELPTLSPAQQVYRLRAFLAAATISNTVASDICSHYDLLIGLPTGNSNSPEDTPFAHNKNRMRRRATLAVAQATVQSCTDQILLVSDATHSKAG